MVATRVGSRMTPPPLRYFVVDAFTDRPFAGNPAAVIPLSEWKNDEWLQNVAMVMSLLETAFLVKDDDGYRPRWFTPNVEVALCGHATLASAHVLWNEATLRLPRRSISKLRAWQVSAK